MKFTIIPVVLFLVTATGSRANSHVAQVTDDTDGNQRKLRRRGGRGQSLLRLAGKIFINANERVASFGPPGTTAVPMPTDETESTQDRSPEVKGAKEETKGITVEGAQATLAPTTVPSDAPSLVPSDAPSTMPSDAPSSLPSDLPSIQPTGNIQGFVRCEEVHACSSGGIRSDDNDGFWMSKMNRDKVTCETTCMLPVAISPRKALGWACGKTC